MNKANECTCPSGDGSLRWPCPAHPAVEQAGGDERAAFKTAYLAEFDCDADGDDNMAHSNTAWRAWKMARAALAQPSPDHAVQAHDIPMLIASEHANPDYAMGWNDCRAKIIGASSAVQAEQAEGAHVPDEVFAGVFAEWWEEEGQYCRAGGGDYERTFAFQAWRHLYPLLLQARAALAHRTPEVCSECSDTGKVYDESGDGPWSCYACTGNPEVIGYANGDELDNMLDDRTAVLSPGKTSFHTVPVYRLIRAALAQPSPAQADEKPGDSILCYGCFAKGVGPDHFDEAGKCLAAQAEAERPEVVAFRYHCTNAEGEPLPGWFYSDDAGTLGLREPLMTVAQHERILRKALGDA
ncbi:TPA: hypothetical protein ACM2XW_001358 [Pseudomonas aeruginosa]|uniref:hypothetical protein n=1 Tax=Pseudomonas aeruginosa TaxID=287 RepID=UPI003003CCCE